MKLKPLVLLALALGCGLVAMLGVQQMMAKKDAPLQEELVKVLYALTDIDAGKPLDETNVAFKDVPKDKVPEGAITTPAEYEKHSLKRFAYAGDVILQSKLGLLDEVGATASIPVGMRLTTVPITMHGINSGMVRPGDRVDIICTYQTQDKGMQVLRTKTVLEYVEVFAVDRQRAGAVDAADSNKGTKYETLTFLCTPQQYLIIQHAKRKGELTMALRKKDDPPKEGDVAELFLDDAKFEALQTGAGADNPFDEKKNESKDDTGAAGLRNVLANAQDEDKKEEEKPAVDPNEWVIRIYEGGNVREEIVGKPSVKQDEKKDATIPLPNSSQKKQKAAPTKNKKQPKAPTI